MTTSPPCLKLHWTVEAFSMHDAWRAVFTFDQHDAATWPDSIYSASISAMIDRRNGWLIEATLFPQEVYHGR